MIYYRFIQGGLDQELNYLDCKEVIQHLQNYLGNFLLDHTVAKVYLARLLREQVITAEVMFWINYLIKKCCDLDPLDKNIRELMEKISGKSDIFLSSLKKYTAPPHVTDQLNTISHLPFENQRRIIWSQLKSYPNSVDLIWRAYMLDFYENIPIGIDWSKIVDIPPEFLGIFEELLMQLYFLQEDIERASIYYERTRKNENHGCRWLNTAAEVAYLLGDINTALSYYIRSIRIDRNQQPILYRIEQITNPLKIDYKTVESSSVAILLYSYNKSEFLRKTLLSIANSRIGRSRIAVLLNGCTDNSKDVVDNVNKEYFNGSLEIISLPVNIGAPAARNWLLSTSIARDAEYIAYLDDDIEVPPDWLVTFLIAIKSYPKAGVIGPKVVYPGKPKRLQYLYRNISIAKEDIIRLSLDTPNFNYDCRVYDFIRPTTTVMGCCHLFTRKALEKVGEFDIRFSPSQMDDITHDLDLRIKGFDVIYCGLVECVHWQLGGIGRNVNANLNKLGNVMGNDVKFFYRFYPYLSFLKNENNVNRDINYQLKSHL